MSSLWAWASLRILLGLTLIGCSLPTMCLSVICKDHHLSLVRASHQHSIQFSQTILPDIDGQIRKNVGEKSVLDVKTKLASIPHEDRFFLERFFNKLIRSEGLGYTLFGSKPVCLSGYFIKIPIGNIIMGSDNFLIKKGWEVWKKYEHLFCHSNYLIFEENHVRGDKNIHPIYFINKKTCLEIIANHHSFFTNELGDTFNSEKFLADIDEKNTLSEMINFHEGLLGILLGYGAESAMQYYKRDLMWHSKLLITHEEIHLQPVSKSNIYQKSILPDIYPIQFVGNPQSQEVQAILKQNAQERAFLLELYSQDDLLEITLKKLTEQ